MPLVYNLFTYHFLLLLYSSTFLFGLFLSCFMETIELLNEAEIKNTKKGRVLYSEQMFSIELWHLFRGTLNNYFTLLLVNFFVHS